MKKLISLLLALLLPAWILPGCGRTAVNPEDSAEKTTEDILVYNPADANPATDFEYAVGEDGGITITKYIGTDTDVVIPEEIDGKPVTVIGEKAFYSNPTLLTVCMPDSVTEIRRCAFASCKFLETVRLSESLEYIGEGGFTVCTALQNITLPDSLSYIGAFGFSYCESLKEITLPANCYKDPVNRFPKYLEEDTTMMSIFAYTGLEHVTLEEGFSYIPQGAFSNNSNLRDIVIPGSVEEIERHAFAECTELEKITLNEGIQSIKELFISETKVSEIIIPKSVTELDVGTFNGATALKTVRFEGNAPKLMLCSTGLTNTDFTVYYHESAEGFNDSNWSYFTTEIW
ncbi:MAG: leucine-rich repeat domain-containing protein [Eubacteriales bacterium]